MKGGPPGGLSGEPADGPAGLTRRAEGIKLNQMEQCRRPRYYRPLQWRLC